MENYSIKDFKTLDSKRKLGISGHLRVKDGSAYLRECLDSVLPWVDELIITYNDCIDDTKKILDEYKHNSKVRIFHYPYKLHGFSRQDSKNRKVTNPNCYWDVHHLSNYYNYGLIKISYEYYMKIDADQIYDAESFKKIIDYLKTKSVFPLKDKKDLAIYKALKKFQKFKDKSALIISGLNLIYLNNPKLVTYRWWEKGNSKTRDRFYPPIINGLGGDTKIFVPNSLSFYMMNNICETLNETSFVKSFRVYALLWIHVGDFDRWENYRKSINEEETIDLQEISTFKGFKIKIINRCFNVMWDFIYHVCSWRYVFIKKVKFTFCPRIHIEVIVNRIFKNENFRFIIKSEINYKKIFEKVQIIRKKYGCKPN